MTLVSHTPSLILAPMDGVTDALMRELLTDRLPFTHCVSEFVRVNSSAPSKRTFLNDIPELMRGAHTRAGTPVHVQILGGCPESMTKAAITAVELGAVAVDINFGCPAPTVNRHDGGATLLKYPERIEAIVRNVRDGLPVHIPVSVKLRLGWDDPRSIYENAMRAERGGASWITIHGRTKFQGYTPPAYWIPIGEVRRNSSIPIVANGEIWNLEDLKKCQSITGCTHFMLGRGVLAEPTLALAAARYLGVSIRRPEMAALENSPQRWTELLTDVIERSTKAQESERRCLARIKQWLNYAAKKGQVSWFDCVKRSTSVEQVREILTHLSVNFLPQEHVARGAPLSISSMVT